MSPLSKREAAAAAVVATLLGLPVLAGVIGAFTGRPPMYGTAGALLALPAAGYLLYGLARRGVKALKRRTTT